jgi:hypothetical protein
MDKGGRRLDSRRNVLHHAIVSNAERCQFNEAATTWDQTVDGVDYEKGIYIFKEPLKVWKCGVAYQPSQFAHLQRLQETFQSDRNTVPDQEDWESLHKDLTFLTSWFKEIKGTTVSMGSETDLPWIPFLAKHANGAADRAAFLTSVGLHEKLVNGRRSEGRWGNLTDPTTLTQFIEQRIMSFDGLEGDEEQMEKVPFEKLKFNFIVEGETQGIRRWIEAAQIFESLHCRNRFVQPRSSLCCR